LTTILTRITCEKTEEAARAVWVNQETADTITSNSLQIMAQASRANLKFFHARKPKCTLSGLFYILGFRFRAEKTQREIADLLCTTEVSVRKSYKSWLNEFPQFFTDVRFKMSENRQADYYRQRISVKPVNCSNEIVVKELR
jgi:transcription initiation factor TFIIIB Brf1 subunit/transcription initiation factor TFIIB